MWHITLKSSGISLHFTNFCSLQEWFGRSLRSFGGPDNIANIRFDGIDEPPKDYNDFAAKFAICGADPVRAYRAARIAEPTGQITSRKRAA
jgi:hypothetical protein